MEEPKPTPQPRSRRKDALIVVAIIVAGIVLMAGTNAYLNGLRERALGGQWQSAVGSLRVMLMVAGGLVALSTLALGAMLWRAGARTVAEAHFPPPGFGITAAKEHTGMAARRIGRFLQLSAVLVVLAGLGATALAFRLAPMA